MCKSLADPDYRQAQLPFFTFSFLLFEILFLLSFSFSFLSFFFPFLLRVIPYLDRDQPLSPFGTKHLL